jgi:hypothetical protein
LLDHILLITAPVGQSHDLFGQVISMVGDVEKVFNVFEKHLRAPA